MRLGFDFRTVLLLYAIWNSFHCMVDASSASPFDPNITVCDDFQPWRQGMCLIDNDGVEHGYCRRCLVGPKWDALRQRIGTHLAKRGASPVIAAGNWVSSTMLATAFRILAQEVLGYDRVRVFVNQGWTFAMDEVGSDGCQAINLEVWKAGEPDLVEKQRKIDIAKGALGTYGWEGLYVPYFIPSWASDYRFLEGSDDLEMSDPHMQWQQYFPADGTIGPEELSEWHSPPHYNCKPDEVRAVGWGNSTCVEGRWYPPACGSKYPSPSCAEIYAVTPKWATGWIEGSVRTLGMNTSVVYLGYEGMLQTIADMHTSRKGSAFYWWEPDGLHSRYKTKLFEIPEGDDECHARHRTNPATSGNNCTLPLQTLEKFMNKNMYTAEPDLAYLFDRLVIDRNMMHKMISFHKDGGGDYDAMEDATCEFLKSGVLEWTDWIQISHNADVDPMKSPWTAKAPAAGATGQIPASSEDEGGSRPPILVILAGTAGTFVAVLVLYLFGTWVQGGRKAAIGTDETAPKSRDIEAAAGSASLFQRIKGNASRSAPLRSGSRAPLISPESVSIDLSRYREHPSTESSCFKNGDIPQQSGCGSDPSFDSLATSLNTAHGRISHGVPGLELSILEVLGKGGASTVYKANWCGATVALKIQNLVSVQNYKDDLPREVYVANTLRHPNVVNQYGFQLVCSETLPRRDASLPLSRKVIESTVQSGKLRRELTRYQPSTSGPPTEKPDADIAPENPGCKVSPFKSSARGSALAVVEPDTAIKGNSSMSFKLDMSTGSATDSKEADVELHIIMEYCSEGSLWHALKTKQLEGQSPASVSGPRPPDVGTALTLAHDVAMGMTYIHMRNVIHGDLKASNVLLVQRDTHDSTKDSAKMAKIADFGLAKELEPEKTSVCGVFGGTVTHAAPELIRCGRSSPATDVYAFGILLYELFSGSRAYKGKRSAQIASEVVLGARPCMPHGTLRPIVELSAACTRASPKERPSMLEVRNTLAALVQEHAIDPVPSARQRWSNRKRRVSGGSMTTLQEDVEEAEESEADGKEDEHSQNCVSGAGTSCEKFSKNTFELVWTIDRSIDPTNEEESDDDEIPTEIIMMVEKDISQRSDNDVTIVKDQDQQQAD